MEKFFHNCLYGKKIIFLLFYGEKLFFQYILFFFFFFFFSFSILFSKNIFFYNIF